MDKLIGILNKVKPEVDFYCNKELITDGILDSIDIVMVLSEIEKEFCIEIDPEEIDPENFQSAEKMLEMINKAIE